MVISLPHSYIVQAQFSIRFYLEPKQLIGQFEQCAVQLSNGHIVLFTVAEGLLVSRDYVRREIDQNGC